MGLRQCKAAVFALLARNDLNLPEFLGQLAEIPAPAAINALFPALCRTDDRIRWRAVSGMGASVARLADADMEAARVVMRRFLWSLNDESGGIGWGAPESLAESMRCHAGLAREYAHMLLSYIREDGPEIWQDGNFLEHPLLQRGVLWGLVRLNEPDAPDIAGENRTALLLDLGAGPEVTPFLDNPDAAIRGLACHVTGLLGVAPAVAALRALQNDPAEFSHFSPWRGGVFLKLTVGGAARTALKQLEQANHAD